MFPLKWGFFEVVAIDILSPLQKLYYILNHIGKAQLLVSPCCYFTSFELIIARACSPLQLDWKVLWKFQFFVSIKLAKNIFVYIIF